jgi:hypothetical protein
MKTQWPAVMAMMFVGFIAIATCARAEVDEIPNYHLVGWTNFFVPGGGQFLLGRSQVGAEQAALEISTFGLGYSLSARSPMTLDGVPEELPNFTTLILPGSGTTQVCVQINSATKQCTRYRTVRGKNATVIDDSNHDITRSIFADILQEIGLKAHMVNIYDSYRMAAEKSGLDLTAHYIDPTPTDELFMAPFEKETLFDPWVYIPLGVTAAALIYSYESLRASNDYPVVARLNSVSSISYDATYLGVFPVGSGAPEEMFYRGFLQSEALSVMSPWLAIPLTTALYSLSHSTSDQLAAAVSGLYLGYLSYHNHGRLKKNVAYHFWSDIMTGIYAIALLQLSQSAARVSNVSTSSQPATMSFQYHF